MSLIYLFAGGECVIMSFFSYKEIIRAKIYDNEALYYGNVCSYELKDKVKIKACLTFNIGDRVPDINNLKKLLEKKGLEVPEDISLEELIITARNENIEIPYIEVESRVDMVKGFIDLKDIALIDTIYRPGSSYDWRIAIIVLNKPREALYRGLPVPYNKPYLEYAEKTIGKIAVSLSEGILGVVEDIVFAPDELGIRVEVSSYRRGLIYWNNFLALLKTRGYEEHAKLLEKDIGSHEKLDIKYYGYITDLLDKYKAPVEAYTLLNNNIEFEEELLEKYRDISWKKILRIGDIVLIE